MIKVLDCTLRDGGYVNNWDFGKNSIDKIITNLTLAKVNFIECGFLKNVTYNPDFSLFSDINQLNDIINNKNSETKYTLMVNYGECPINNIQKNSNKNIILRISFKKKHLIDAINYAKSLKDKGYELFLNPMNTDLYSIDDLKYLVNEANKLNPFALTIVDTIGCMCEKDAVNIYVIIDRHLNPDIKICFHSHNNLQLSFPNALALINLSKERDLIIDSTLFAMGRGAGNVRTEQIIKYLNDNCNSDFDYIPIVKLIDDVIYPIFIKSPWGCSTPYYLAALHHCHPNYAKFIADKGNINTETIIKILNSIPPENKYEFNADIINDLYNKFFIY